MGQSSKPNILNNERDKINEESHNSNRQITINYSLMNVVYSNIQEPKTFPKNSMSFFRRMLMKALECFRK